MLLYAKWFKIGPDMHNFKKYLTVIILVQFCYATTITVKNGSSYDLKLVGSIVLDSAKVIKLPKIIKSHSVDIIEAELSNSYGKATQLSATYLINNNNFGGTLDFTIDLNGTHSRLFSDLVKYNPFDNGIGSIVDK